MSVLIQREECPKLSLPPPSTHIARPTFEDWQQGLSLSLSLKPQRRRFYLIEYLSRFSLSASRTVFMGFKKFSPRPINDSEESPMSIFQVLELGALTFNFSRHSIAGFADLKAMKPPLY